MRTLILGIGSAQVDAINYCRMNGMFVYGVSYKKEGPGLDLVDHFEQIDILDREKIIEFIKINDIQLVFSIGSDIGLWTQAYVSSTLNLPSFISIDKINTLQDKYKIKNLLFRNGLCSNHFQLITHAKDAQKWQCFPAIIKPVDGQGQRGVTLINNYAELTKYFSAVKAFSVKGEVLIEQLVKGKEISVNVFIVEGEIVHFFISDRITINDLARVGIVREHITPAIMTADTKNKVKELLQKLVKIFDIQNGPAYAQIIWNKDAIYPIEFVPRLDGCHLWRLIKFTYGVDLLDLSFKMLMQNLHKETLYSTLEINEPHKIIYDLQPPGDLYKSKESESFNLINVKYYKDGEFVKPINGYFEKTGYSIQKVIV